MQDFKSNDCVGAAGSWNQIHRNYPSSRDSSSQAQAEFAVLDRPHVAVVASLIKICFLDLHQADGNCLTGSQ